MRRGREMDDMERMSLGVVDVTVMRLFRFYAKP